MIGTLKLKFSNFYRTNNNGVETVETYENDVLKNRTVGIWYCFFFLKLKQHNDNENYSY